MKLRSLLGRVFGGEHEPHVLCADDDSDVRALCGAALRRAVYAVDEAADGREAREKLDRNRYAAVLLDLAMPYRMVRRCCRCCAARIRNCCAASSS